MRTAGSIAGAEHEGGWQDPTRQSGQAGRRRLQREFPAEAMVSHRERLAGLRERRRRPKEAAPLRLAAARCARVRGTNNSHSFSHLQTSDTKSKGCWPA